MLRFRSLGSGSSGNATWWKPATACTTRLLVDCGLGIRQLESRLAQAGVAPGGIDAIFITHEHGDHIGCARAFLLREPHSGLDEPRHAHAAIDAPDFDGPCCAWHATLNPLISGELQLQRSPCHMTPANRCS